MLLRNVKYETGVPLVASEISLHKTFMDTVGRTTLKLSAMNVVDESRDKDLIVRTSFPRPHTILMFVR